MNMQYINKEFCKGCEICVEFCPTSVLEISTELTEKGIFPVLAKYPEKCTCCHLCELYCPDFAISVDCKR
jgi:2-oxoglutarate ferredoxin oxidoreductase subunit delta